MSSSLSRSAKLADTAEARLEELRRSTQGTMHRWAGAGGRGIGFIYTVVRGLPSRYQVQWQPRENLLTGSPCTRPQAHALCWIAVLVSIGNAMWLFTRRRQYRLFLRRVGAVFTHRLRRDRRLNALLCAWQDPINSPNAKTVRLGNAAMQRRMEGGSEPEGGAETDALWKRCLCVQHAPLPVPWPMIRAHEL